MTYDGALGYIHSIKRLGWQPGLSRMRELCAALGDPQNSLRFIHVAGTNGKGSTVAMITSVLQAAGYKTGMYVSPYIEDFRERIRVDGMYISPDDVARHTETIKYTIDSLIASGSEHPTEYEVVTALAFLYFAETRPDFVALEVGMGGRLDMTNVIAPPLAAVITHIAYDHIEYLGDTLEKIAYEKCGIIKPGGRAVCYPEQETPALDTIKAICAERGVPLTIPRMDALEVLASGIEGSDICYGGQDYHIPLIGAHQIKNALTVLATLDVLRGQGIAIPQEAVYSGLSNISWGGRLEIVRRDPLCIVDGGHNSDCIHAVCAFLDAELRGRRLISIMGMSRDKDYAYCVPEIAKRSAVFFAATYDSARALTAREVYDAALGHCDDCILPANMEDAVARAFDCARPGDLILACGSLYLIGDAKKIIQKTALPVYFDKTHTRTGL